MCVHASNVFSNFTLNLMDALKVMKLFETTCVCIFETIYVTIHVMSLNINLKYFEIIVKNN